MFILPAHNVQFLWFIGGYLIVAYRRTGLEAPVIFNREILGAMSLADERNQWSCSSIRSEVIVNGT